MAERSALLDLPYIMPSQAQKHVTHNEALRMLDAVAHIAVETAAIDAPPDEPAEGQRCLVGDSPEGAFAGHRGEIAAFQDGDWTFFAPRPGWTLWQAGRRALLVFDGSEWAEVAPTPAQLAQLGINAGADTTNRLAVAADATLLTHDGAGHQLKLNKAATGDTASLLFQTGWSGRAEMGLAGNDDFSVKVSSNGNAWRTALIVRAGDGTVGIGGSPLPTMQFSVTSPNAMFGLQATDAARWAGLKIYNNAGAPVGGFQYGNPAATDSANELVFASFAAGVPMKFHQGGVGSASERLRFDASGRIALLNARVGVGTAEPVAATLLEARLDQAFPNITRIAVNNPNASGLSAFSLYGGPGNVERGRMQYNHGAGSVFFTTIGTVPFYIGTNDTARIVITPAGSVNVTAGAVAPVASAKLQIDSTTQGFLPPRMTQAQRDAISAPAEGLIVYNATAHEPQFWNGTGWVAMR